jgi:purine-nucleoside phosphorylase
LPFERVRKWEPHAAIILGSGLNGLIGDVNRDRIVSYSDIGEIPRSTVKGHLGRFVLDEIGGTPVVFAQGRTHLYEGRSAREVTAGVRFLARAGIKELIVTNAAGSANPDFAPGSWMMITDQINLSGTSPLVGASRCDAQDAVAQRPYQSAPEFVDMTNAYSPRLRENFQRAASKIDMLLHEGIYAGLLGPQYETPAEVRMLQKLGTDAIGMSTVLEVIQARALGLEVAGFSCLTNFAAGLSKMKLSHNEVLQTGQAATDHFGRLLSAFFSQ